MIGVIVLKQFQKFVKVKNGTPFKNFLFFYLMLIHHLSNIKHGVTIRERESESDRLRCNKLGKGDCNVTVKNYVHVYVFFPKNQLRSNHTKLHKDG